MLLISSLGGFGEISPSHEEAFYRSNLLTRSFGTRPFFCVHFARRELLRSDVDFT
jgi:hypothetical protein